MSIKFKKLSIQNFLSFGQKPITIDLDSSNNTLIVGENRDVGSEGYSRNGVGKSTIFQALTWVIYNEGISSIKQDSFINIINKKNMVVELEMEVDGIEYVIRRGRKPAVCEILKNGDPYTNHSIHTVDDTIEDLMGINYDTFCNTVMLNTTTTPFMNLKPTGQRNFMEKMVGLDILTERADTIKSKNKDIVIEIKLEEQTKEHTLSNIRKANDNVEYLQDKESSWKDTNKESIKETKETIETMSELDTVSIMKINEEIRIKNEHVKEVKQVLSDSSDLKTNEEGELYKEYNRSKEERLNKSKLVVVEINKSKQEDKVKLMSSKETFVSDKSENKDLLREANSIIKEFDTTITSNNTNIVKLKDEVSVLESGECPYCHQSHFDDKKVASIQTNIELLSNEISELTEEIGMVEESIPGIDSDINEAQSKIDNIESEIKDINDSCDALVEKEESRNKTEDEVFYGTYLQEKDDIVKKFDKIGSELKEKIYTISEDVPESDLTDEECHTILNDIKHQVVRLKELKAEINPYTEQVVKAEKDVVVYDESILENLKKKENHYKLLIKLLTDNKSFVRKNLLDQYVPFINTKIEGYLEKIELPHRIRINNDLSVSITYMTHPISYGNLSNGEACRTNFAVSMAFKDLMSVSGHHFNFLGVDELFDGQGLDSAGMFAVWKILKDKTDSIFVITHREELLSEADEIMTIVKENGFSRIQ